MKVRQATADDLPAVARLTLRALGAESPWSSIIPPGAHQNPQYIEQAEAFLKKYIASETDDKRIFVVEIPSSEGASAPQIVSTAVWDLGAPATATDSSDVGLPPNNADPSATSTTPNGSAGSSADVDARLNSVRSATSAGQKKYFSEYGQHLSLQVLATRPDFQRRGYGKALCKIALEAAREKSMAVGIQSGPAGYVFLSGMGFMDLGPVVVPAAKGRDELVLKALALPIGRAERRGSLFDSFLKYVTE